MGCWGLLGWLLIVSQWIIPENSLRKKHARTSKFLLTIIHHHQSFNSPSLNRLLINHSPSIHHQFTIVYSKINHQFTINKNVFFPPKARRFPDPRWPSSYVAPVAARPHWSPMENDAARGNGVVGQKQMGWLKGSMKTMETINGKWKWHRFIWNFFMECWWTDKPVGNSPGTRWRFQTGKSSMGGNQDCRIIILFLFGTLKMAFKTADVCGDIFFLIDVS